MLLLPPLESLRFFESAARHQSFARAAAEIGVTPAAVAHRVRSLEKHLDVPLFDRRRRGVMLNPRGQTYLKEVQRILAEVHGVSERQRRWPSRVRIVSVEAVAEKWLLPRLASFKAAHPDIAIEIETNHRGVDPERRDFDAWFAYTGETAAPRPVTRREDTLLEETLYEEQPAAGLQPGPARRARAPRRRGGPRTTGPCSTTWDGTPTGPTGSRRQGQCPRRTWRAPPASASTACLCEAAVQRARGRRRTADADRARARAPNCWCPVFDGQTEAPERCCLITTAAARQRPEVQAFREWVLREAATASRPATARPSDATP